MPQIRYLKRKKFVFGIRILLYSLFTLAFSSILIVTTNFVKNDIFATSETRYFRSDTQSVNSLSAYKLDTTQSSSNLSTSITVTGSGSGTSYWGIRVWKRNSSGTETEITSGTPVAQVSRTSSGSGLQSATWTPTETTLATTDSIVVRVYIQINSGGWQQGGTAPIFTTEQLGDTLLDGTEWTVYYYTQDARSTSGPPNSRYVTATYHWGNSTYNSRIVDFSHSSGSTVITVGSYGTQRTSVEKDTTDIHMGGAFTFVRGTSSTSVTSITISNTGTISDSDLTGLDLYYKQESTCSDAMPGDATLFNSTSGTFSSGSSTVTGSMTVSTSQICLYVDLDIGADASKDETIELEITDPSSDVTASSGTVTPTTAVAISGTTTVAENEGPSFTVFSDDGPKEPGQDITFTATSTDPNGDTVSMAVCKTTGYTTNTEYDMDFPVYSENNFDVSTQEGSPSDFATSSDGTKMYIIGANDTVYQYTLSTAWDVSTASYASKSYNIPPGDDPAPISVTFSSDGTKMFISGDNSNNILQYTLSTAWDVSTASYASKSFSVTSQETSPYGLVFSSDGTKMFVVGSDHDTVYQYTLSTAWDVSTASYASKSFSVGTQETSPYGLVFSSDGTKMFVVGYGTDTVYQYTLSTAWDVSTASYASKSFSVATQDGSPRDLDFNSDGTKLYLMGASSDTVYQYNLPGITCDGGNSDTYCVTNLVASNPSCSYDIPIPTPDTTYNVYPYVFDMFEEPSTSSLQGTVDTYTVSNASPIVSGVTINSGSAITLTEGTTKAVTLTGTVTDYNGCSNSEISSVKGYVYRSGIGSENSSKFCDISIQPETMEFKPDGLKLYVIGSRKDTVYQYSLSTAWDISTISYDYKYINITSQEPELVSLTFSSDGTKMYVVGTTNDTIYQYLLSTAWDISTAAYTYKSLDIGDYEENPSDLTFSSDGTKLYLLGYDQDRVGTYPLSTAWDITTWNSGVSFFYVSSQDGISRGISFNSDGTKMYILGSSNDTVYQYTLSTAWSPTSASYDSKSYSVNTQSIFPVDISFNSTGSKMYILDNSSDSIFQYSISTSWDVSSSSYSSTSFVVSTTNSSFTETTFSSDGFKMYVLGRTNVEVYQFTLSSSFDTSTASYASKSFSVSTQDFSPTGLAFNSDGTKMFMVGYDTDTVYQYTLSTAWDVSTASYASKSFSVATQNNYPYSLAFSSDGTKMFVFDYVFDTVYQYTLSTAWDVSTASYTSKSFSVATQESLPYGLAFSSDGTKMYVVGTSNDTVYQYTLSTAWDVSTASYTSKSFSVATQESLPSVLAFSSDGTKMFVVGSTNVTVYQYTLSTAWDVSTASYYGNARESCDSPGEANNNYCYPEITCTYVTDSCTGSTDSSSNYTCTVNLQSYADPTDSETPYVTQVWLDALVATDNNSATGYREVTAGVDVNSLVAFNITSSIFYGNLGEEDSNDPLNITTTTTPTGNTGLDHELYGPKYMCPNFPGCLGFSVYSQENAPNGLSFSSDGTKMYILGFSNDSIYQYTLSTAWDISTATYATKSFSVTTQEGSPWGLAFSSDGTKMYVVGTTNDTVYQYTLSTAWDVSTATYASKSISVNTQDTSPHDLTFSSDGTKMYISGSTNDTVYQYTLSTAWDVSTASYASKSFSVATQETSPYGLSFNSDGSKMYIIGATNDTVYEYVLSTDWDVSTASYDSDYVDVSVHENICTGLAFNSNGTKLYVLGQSGDSVYELTISSAWDISSTLAGTIAVANQKYSLTSSTAYSSGTTLSTSPATVLINIAKATSSSPSTKNLYWGIYIPTGTETGTYHGNITVTAVKSHPGDW
jgi:DNA-binding beta-propeller fold protein YncE